MAILSKKSTTLLMLGTLQFFACSDPESPPNAPSNSEQATSSQSFLSSSSTPADIPTACDTVPESYLVEGHDIDSTQHPKYTLLDFNHDSLWRMDYTSSSQQHTAMLYSNITTIIAKNSMDGDMVSLTVMRLDSRTSDHTADTTVIAEMDSIICNTKQSKCISAFAKQIFNATPFVYAECDTCTRLTLWNNNYGESIKEEPNGLLCTPWIKQSADSLIFGTECAQSGYISKHRNSLYSIGPTSIPSSFRAISFTRRLLDCEAP
jgi:hypothetical protein